MMSNLIQLNDPVFSNNRIYSPKGLSPTLNTMQGGRRQPLLMVEANIIRKLTPVECERLQAFPDNWTEGLSNSQRYKCIGNSVTTTVVTVLLNRLYENKSN
jgi:DNA (cytosine-5)-methyltransferase 1